MHVTFLMQHVQGNIDQPRADLPQPREGRSIHPLEINFHGRSIPILLPTLGELVIPLNNVLNIHTNQLSKMFKAV